ncbi:MAG TPA: hypothetical protein VHE35_15690, partial [Kofleriaceae bacterium]|nr:hypothetical protein [Kofleriaceae bacterium]
MTGVPGAPGVPDPRDRRDGLARVEYDLQLHRAHLRAMRAVVRREPEVGRDVLAKLDDELATIEAALAALPADAHARPMLRLADALGLDGDELDLLWTAVALAGNPPTRIHAQELDELALHGLTTTAYCRMVELSPERSRALGLRVLADHPAVQHGLLRAGNLERLPSGWTLAPAIELVTYLAGEPRFDPDCVLLARPEAPILDPRQEAAVASIAQTLAAGDPLALFVEGPALTGRRTAVALAAGRPALAVELARAPT